MGKTSSIQWLDGGHTASPWHGCEHATYTDSDGNEQICDGCLHCYAEKNAKRNPGTLGVWGPDGTRVRSASFWSNCRRWNREAQAAGKPAIVFPSICDPFESWDGPILDSDGFRGIIWRDGKIAWTPISKHDPHKGDEWRWLTLDDLRRDLFALIDECPWLTFLLLTKRPQNILRMWPGVMGSPDDIGGSEHTLSLHRENVWLITSVSDQATAEALIPELLRCRDLSPVLGISLEPMLGPVDLSRWMSGLDVSRDENGDDAGSASGGSDLDWVIVGGESGHGARPMRIEWAQSVVEQVRAACVLCFLKQLGASVYWCAGEHQRGFWPLADDQHGNGYYVERVKLRDKKGGDISEFPPDLRVRETPERPVPGTACHRRAAR